MGSYARRWPRLRLDVPIRVIVHGDNKMHGANKTVVFQGRGNELSAGGISVTAGVELNVGDKVEIEFMPPYSGTPMRIRGVVRNREGYRYGLEFLASNEEEVKQVDNLGAMLQVMSSS